MSESDRPPIEHVRKQLPDTLEKIGEYLLRHHHPDQLIIEDKMKKAKKELDPPLEEWDNNPLD